MFVGETGVGRVIERACQLMKENKNEDAREEGGIDLETIQRYVNFWFSSSVDLFGGEISSNAADYFASGLKGRDKEQSHYDDHVELTSAYDMEVFENGRIVRKPIPSRNAMNEMLRDAYIKDNQRGVDRWNKVIAKHGIDFEITLPHRRFNRSLGIYAGHHFDPQGNPISEEQFEAKRSEWLPTEADKVHVKSLMTPVLERGKIAQWLAPPVRGINGQPFDYEYIRKV